MRSSHIFQASTEMFSIDALTELAGPGRGVESGQFRLEFLAEDHALPGLRMEDLHMRS